MKTICITVVIVFIAVCASVLVARGDNTRDERSREDLPERQGEGDEPRFDRHRDGNARHQICTNALTGTFRTIVVPDGESCTLYRAIVQGNVRVKRNASLFVGPPGSSSIRGNVEAERCMTVLLSGTVIVDGNVEIEHCATKSGYVGPGVQIGRNFECRHNSGPCVAYSGTVRGHVKIDHNASAVATDISVNTIRGSLECHSNVPAPTHTFGANKVTGKADGECAASLGFTVSVGSFPPTAAKAAGGRWVRARSLLAQESFRGPL